MFRSTGINEIKGSLSINWKPTEYWLWAGLNEAAGGENISPSQAVFVFVYQRSHRGGISHSSQTLRTRRPSGICATTWAFYTSTAVVLASGRVFLNTQAKHICFFFTRTYKIMWFTCFNTCWSSVRVCYDVFAQHLKDFSLIFHILEIETSTWWERSHTSKIWITWHIRANPQFIRHIIHFIYPLFIFVHLNNQSSEDTLRENCTFLWFWSFFSNYKNFWHKIQSELMLGSVGGVFMWDFMTGGVQVNESIKEQVHLKISKRKHFPHKQISKKQRSAMYKRCFGPWRRSAEVCAG